MAEKGTLVVYGDAIGRMDCDGLFKQLARKGYGGCVALVKAEPHEKILKLLADDGRVEVVVAADPPSAAKKRVASVQGDGAACTLARLDDVSDRAFSRCPC